MVLPVKKLPLLLGSMCQVALSELASGTSSCCSEHPLSSLGIPPLFDLASPSSRGRLLFPLPGQTSRILLQMGSNQSLGIPLKPPSIMCGYLHHMLSQIHLNCHSRPLKPQEKPLPRRSNQNSPLLPAITTHFTLYFWRSGLGHTCQGLRITLADLGNDMDTGN